MRYITPAKESPLTTDLDGEPFDEDWEHASVVGMLMHLVNTRPDMQFAVHQCGKCSHNPRASHAKAVKKICRYLQGTKSRRIRFKKKLLDPMDMRLVDASFCPNWKQLSFERSDGETKSKVGRLISQFQEFAKASFK